GMTVQELKAFIDAHRSKVVHQLISKSYRSQAIKGVAIPKANRLRIQFESLPECFDYFRQLRNHAVFL
ncbi:hypothetical protein, partial [Cellulophaga sp. Z1A5H]|uniref:hypothetical protein n=1 Tax=Cellulophaga sp. Z1A5H TaxID=2687291 RepID=UPI00196A676E